MPRTVIPTFKYNYQPVDTYKKNRVIGTLIKTKIDNADLILCAFSYEEEVTVACSFFPIFLERKKAGGYIMAF